MGCGKLRKFGQNIYCCVARLTGGSYEFTSFRPFVSSSVRLFVTKALFSELVWAQNGPQGFYKRVQKRARERARSRVQYDCVAQISGIGF